MKTQAHDSGSSSWYSLRRDGRYIRRIRAKSAKQLAAIGTMAGIIASATSVIIAYYAYVDHTPHPIQQAGALSHYSIVDPAPGEDPAEPCRFTVHGKGLPPEDKELVLATQADDSGKMLIQSGIRRDALQNAWSKTVTVTIPDRQLAADARISVSVYLMDEGVEEYIRETRRNDRVNPTTWMASEAPPNSEQVATAQVHLKPGIRC